MSQRLAPALLLHAQRLGARGVAAVLLPAVWCMAPAAAQTAAASASAPASSAARADKSEAAAAMERAQRMAANPLRIILEAGKVKRAPGEGVPVTTPQARTSSPPATAVTGARAATAALPTTAVATPSAGPDATPSPATPSPASPSAATPAAMPPVARPSGAPEPAVAIPPVGAPLTERPADAAPVPAAAANPGAPLQGSRPAPAVTPQTADPVPPPRLLDMVEPALPSALLAGLNANTEVAIDLTIRADGSVANVALLPPFPRQLQRYIVSALERWRFAPLPAQSVHRINLVFNAPS